MLSAQTKKGKVKNLVTSSWKEVEQMKKTPFFCPVCQDQVMIKNSRIKTPHFSHYNKYQCMGATEGETAEHLSLKRGFAIWCEKQNIEYQLEPFLKELNQRPDLLIGKIAIEIQCSPLSIERLIERPNTYQRYGYGSIWILGKNLLPQITMRELTKYFCYFSKQIGFYLWTADWEKEELGLLMHLEEDWQKKLYYSKKVWSFYVHDLIPIFDFPNTKSFYSQRVYPSEQLMHLYHLELTKKLFHKNEQIRRIQAVFYKDHQHILHLPRWFYYPGVRIFCCKSSDLFLKQQLWQMLGRLNGKTFTKQQLVGFLKTELSQAYFLFYDFPNIDFEQIQWFCLNQIFSTCVDCGIFIRREKSWSVFLDAIDNSKNQFGRSSNNKLNKVFISATPFKSMIR